jgi:dinuclear metal center YbgI/SA1388 family protein
MDTYLDIGGHADYRTALNGLQVAGPTGRPVRKLAAAVDASEATIARAVETGADVLVVHHGLFWEGLRPLTGRRYRRVQALIEGGLALYSAHLPLDSHAEVGNSVLLARALGFEPEGRFARYEDVDLGWTGTLDPGLPREDLRARVSATVDGQQVTLLAGGPETIERVAVVTGGGGSFIEEAARTGAHALVTGEGSHHTFVDAMELGINVYYAGHYATETFGVQALCRHLAERFDLTWCFLDEPSGL